MDLKKLIYSLQDGTSEYGDIYEIKLVGLNGLLLKINKEIADVDIWNFTITQGDKITTATTNNIGILSYFS